MQLPTPIRAYFHADQDPAGAAPIRAFAPDAVVRDEGETHVGREAIAAWWGAAKAAFRHASEPLDASGDGDRVVVRAEVTGRFPGSPAVLAFAFQLRNGEIAALEIRA